MGLCVPVLAAGIWEEGEGMSEDKTYCMNRNCGYLQCSRNPKHIKLSGPHSFMYLERTEDCYKTVNHVADRIVTKQEVQP